MKSLVELYLPLLLLVALDAPAKPYDLFPDKTSLPGWNSRLIQKYRSSSELFTYMDGGAELYLEYRFRELSVGEYHHPVLGDLTVEIYRFAAPEDAFGIFSLDTTGITFALGQGARAPDSSVAGSVRFWKGDCYVRVFAWQAKPELQAVLLSAARSVENRIMLEGILPAWLQNWQKAGRVSFIRGDIALRQVAGSQTPDQIPFDPQVGAAWIQPVLPELNTVNLPGCLILKFTDSNTANNAFKGVWSRVSSGASNSAMASRRGLAYLEKKGVVGLECTEDFILWVPRSPDEAICAAVLDRLKSVLAEGKE